MERQKLRQVLQELLHLRPVLRTADVGFEVLYTVLERLGVVNYCRVPACDPEFAGCCAAVGINCCCKVSASQPCC